MRKLLLYLIILIFLSHVLPAQHEHMNMEKDTMKMGHDSLMTNAFSRNLPMNRTSSGTAWQPDATPIYAYIKMTKKWVHMFQGSIFLRYNNQDVTSAGIRGGTSADIPNWFMAMGQRRIGKRGLFRYSGMFSLDALTITGGYPLLFQTGETWQGKPLFDKQHPHDLFDELSISYAHMISKDIDIFGYLAYPGEPSLGPPAFMHRISTVNNYDAPLAHHWQDATHIVFGVATIGFRYKKFYSMAHPLVAENLMKTVLISICPGSILIVAVYLSIQIETGLSKFHGDF